MNRRIFMSGMSAAGFAALTGCDGSGTEVLDHGPLAFTSGPLADNKVGRLFRAIPPGLELPDFELAGEDGLHRLQELMGKIHILVLWAEWCSSCRFELRQLAKVQSIYGDSKVAVQTVLSGGRKNLNAQGARAELMAIDAGNLPVWVEPGEAGGALTELCGYETKAGLSYAIPCTIIMDAAGRMRRRLVGDFPEEVWPSSASTEANRKKSAFELFVEALMAGGLD